MVADRQVAAESVTAGLSSASFCWIASALRYSASASDDLPVLRTGAAEVVVAACQICCWKSATAGLSSASFCWIASALRYSASASDGLPVLDSRMPRLLWLIARWLRKSVTAGLSSASFCWIASALRYSASASDGLPVAASRLATCWIVAARSCRDSARRPGGGGQRLLVGTRQAEDRQGFVVAARGVEEPAETRPAVCQDSPRRGALRDRRGQFDQQGLGLAVRHLRLSGLVRWPPADRRRPSGCGHVGLDLRVGRVSAASASRAARTCRWAASASSGLPTLPVSSATS